MDLSDFFERVNPSKSIKHRLIIYLVFMILITNVLLGYQAFTSGRTSTERTHIEHLTSIADMKESELELWLFQRIQDVKTIADDPELEEFFESLNPEIGVVTESSENRYLQEKAQHRLQLMKDNYGYKSAFVTDTFGRVLISTEEGDEGKVLNADYITKPLAAKEAYIEDISKTSNGDILMVFSSPVFNIHHGQRKYRDIVLGIVVLTMDMEKTVYPMIESWPGMGQTGETLLVRREDESILFLNRLRHKKDAALNLQISADSDIAHPAIFASAGDEGIIRALDYREVEVLSAYRHIPTTNWGFVAKMDTKEAFANVEDLKKRIVLLSTIASLVAVLMAYMISSSITGPIISLEKLTKRISEGDFTIHPKIERKDEIGSLAKSFGKMEKALEKSRKELHKYSRTLEEKVEEKTRDLRDKNIELEQVIYATSHDLRSPLVNIQGFSKEADQAFKEVSQVLDSNNVSPEIKEKLAPYLDEDIPESLQFIQSGVSKMDALISGLLRLSRLGRISLNFKQLDMNKLISDVIAVFEFQIKERGVTIKVDELPLCVGDEAQINQVFSNIIDNALKWFDPNRKGVITISGREEKGHAVYCVDDNGIGIAAEHQDKIFEIFHRLDPRAVTGEGLGLTFARKILDRHDGRIWPESGLGRGSKFFVSIPNFQRKPREGV